MILVHFNFGPISFSSRSATHRRYFYVNETRSGEPSRSRFRAQRGFYQYTYPRRILADVEFEVTTIEFRNAGRPHPVGMFWILHDQDILSWTHTYIQPLVTSRNERIPERLTLRSADSMVIQFGVDVAGRFSSSPVR